MPSAYCDDMRTKVIRNKIDKAKTKKITREQRRVD